ncbi:hypothetical protein [Halalkalicoccus ordinarius]|uniref:hypothetical protein n=1 Tax=Halalkalicoccus ordinarius TaxID=3116651 RepID=UPI00300E7E0A
MSRESLSGFSEDLFGSSEESLLDSIKREGRLDPDREVHRIINITYDILTQDTRLNNSDTEEVYKRLKRFFLREHHKTEQYHLQGDEMYVWYLSTISLLNQFKRQLQVTMPKESDEVESEFRSIVENNYREYLSKLSDINNTRDIGDLLDPVFEDIIQPIHYISNENHERIRMGTHRTRDMRVFRESDRNNQQEIKYG